jgi:peptidoglycan/LPS O-acetylase OafA/YrhL
MSLLKEAFNIDRYEELDSLRGIASLSVFFSHMYLIFHETIVSKLLFEYGLLRIVVAGSEAVTLFFVLSGFVLSLPFYTNKHFNYGAYVIKRFCRIYIPYLIAMVITVLCREMFYIAKIEGLTDWFNVNWSQSLDYNSIKDHLLLVGTFTSNINNVVWSLVHEMRISLVFPIIMFLLIKLDFKKGFGLAIVLSSISIIISFTSKNPFLGTELYYTIHCTSLFIVGALLAKYRVNIIEKFSVLTKKSKLILFLLGIILYLYAHPSFVLNILIQDINPFYRAVIDTWFTSFGASILIVFAISPSMLSRILRNRFINYIGKISYSLYLTHLAVLFSSVHLLCNILPLWSICLITVIATFTFSSFMYHLVEQPSMKIGKFFTTSVDTNTNVESGYNRPI